MVFDIELDPTCLKMLYHQILLNRLLLDLDRLVYKIKHIKNEFCVLCQKAFLFEPVLMSRLEIKPSVLDVMANPHKRP